jgi:hypothetical protein
MGNWTGEPTSYSYRWEVGGMSAGLMPRPKRSASRRWAECHLHGDGDERRRLDHRAGIQQRARRVTVSIGTIAQQALRRLGVRVVPLDDSPTLTELVPAATIATNALVELGVIASDETPSVTDQALAVDKVASVRLARCRAWCGVWRRHPGTSPGNTPNLPQHTASSWQGGGPAVVALLGSRVRKGHGPVGG